MNEVTRIENGERVTDRDSEITDMLSSGALGLSVLRIWPILVRCWHLKTAVFWFWCLALFTGFSNLGWFLSKSDFSGLAKVVTLCSRAKTVVPRDHLYSVLPFLFEGRMTSSPV